MTFTWILAAMAQSLPALPTTSEEILVWGDRFARWERRWWVETEVHFGTPFELLAEDNASMRLGRVQVRAVLDCDRDIALSTKKWEVLCTIEDIAFIGATNRPGPNDLAVLQQVDAAITGLQLQLQVHEDGGVPNVGIEGTTTQNVRDRERVEGYRQLISRVILPFHLGLPKVIHSGAKWFEYNSRLMSMPSETGSGGSTSIAHFMNTYQGMLVVQSIGEGVIRPTMGIDMMSMEAGTGVATASSLPVDTYETNLHGVAVFELDTGIMAERVWTMSAGLTASSPNVLRGFTYHHSGRLSMLGQADRPSVGPTHIARTSTEAPGENPVWIPLTQ